MLYQHSIVSLAKTQLAADGQTDESMRLDEAIDAFARARNVEILVVSLPLVKLDYLLRLQRLETSSTPITMAHN